MCFWWGLPRSCGQVVCRFGDLCCQDDYFRLDDPARALITDVEADFSRLNGPVTLRAAAAEDVWQKGRARNVKVLIAEDDARLADVLARSLADAGRQSTCSTRAPLPCRPPWRREHP